MRRQPTQGKAKKGLVERLDTGERSLFRLPAGEFAGAYIPVNRSCRACELPELFNGTGEIVTLA